MEDPQRWLRSLWIEEFLFQVIHFRRLFSTLFFFVLFFFYLFFVCIEQEVDYNFNENYRQLDWAE